MIFKKVNLGGGPVLKIQNKRGDEIVRYRT